MTQDNEYIRNALTVTGRFGFISRDIFWNHICHLQRAANYRNWSKLLASGYFRAYDDSLSHLYLSRKGVLAIQESNQIWVGKAHPIYFKHDEVVMSLALALESKDLIKSHWFPDAVLKKLSNLEITKVLGAQAQKIPDLVFDLNMPHYKTVRCAVEIEKTRKSLKRYDSLILSYMQMKSVDLVIVAYNDIYTERGIKSSMKRLGYPQNQRPISFCRIADIKANPISFPFAISGNVIGFDKFVQNLRSLNTVNDQQNVNGGVEKHVEMSLRNCLQKVS